jgi:hypothetical protein
MKTQQLRQIVREEISNILNENEAVPDKNEYKSKLYDLEKDYTRNKAGLEKLIEIYESQVQVLRSILNREFS